MVVRPCVIQHHSSHQGWASWRALAKIRAGLIGRVRAWRDRFRAGSLQRKACKPKLLSMQGFGNPRQQWLSYLHHTAVFIMVRGTYLASFGRKDSGLIGGVWVWCDEFWVGLLQRKSCKPGPLICERFWKHSAAMSVAPYVIRHHSHSSHRGAPLGWLWPNCRQFDRQCLGRL